METFQIFSLVISLAALFSFINVKYLKLPTTIGVMAVALIFSLILMALNYFFPGIEAWAEKILLQIDFSKALMEGFLSFLLFAGALHINLADLKEQKFPIFLLATFGVIGSTFLIGGAMYWICNTILGLSLSFGYSLLFGALISPTDPIAVLSVLKEVKVPKSLETKIAGESLFNDGIGVVLFLTLSEIFLEGHSMNALGISKLLLQEFIGGIMLGALLGGIVYYLTKNIDHYQAEIMLTLALVAGGYALATALHTSGPIAIVVAGLMIGNTGRKFGMSDQTRENVDKFWELIDEILNIILFVLIGLEILIITFSHKFAFAGLIAIPICLIARWVMVALSVKSIEKISRQPFKDSTISILTWAGLRGGISIALALSLPSGDSKNLILSITYFVVIFSILTQGLTTKQFIASKLKNTNTENL